MLLSQNCDGFVFLLGSRLSFLNSANSHKPTKVLVYSWSAAYAFQSLLLLGLVLDLDKPGVFWPFEG